METLGGAAALIAVVGATWASGQVDSLTAAAWGRRRLESMTWVIVGSITVVIGVEVAGLLGQEWATSEWAKTAGGICGGISIGVTGAMTIMLWVWRLPYMQWNAREYCVKVYEVAERGTDKEVAETIRKLEQDCRRIVSWANDGARGLYDGRTVEELGNGWRRIAPDKMRMYAAGEYAQEIVEKMGEPRMAAEIVRQGGRLAKKVMEEMERQGVGFLPVGSLRGNVTREAIEREDSFLDNEVRASRHRQLGEKSRATTQALWGTATALMGDTMTWVNPWTEGRGRWNERQIRRWMAVASMVAQASAESEGRFGGGLLHHVAEGLGQISHDNRGNSESEKRRAVEERVWRLVTITRHAKGKSKRHHRLFAETFGAEAIAIVEDAAELEDEAENWNTKAWVWRQLTWDGQHILDGKDTPHEAMVEAVCKKVWQAHKQYIEEGWNKRGQSITRMLLWVRAGERKVTLEGRIGWAQTEDDLIKNIEESVRKNVLKAERLWARRGMQTGRASTVYNHYIEIDHSKEPVMIIDRAMRQGDPAEKPEREVRLTLEREQ